MKRYLPLVIILVVALVTLGVGTWFYRTKMQATARAVAEDKARAASAPAQVEEPEGGSSLHIRGPAAGPVKLEIYGDFQCPACAATSAAIDELQKEYDGKVRVVFHEFPLAMHAHAVQAAMAAEAAAEQGQFWAMHDMLYRYQNIWSKVGNPDHFFSAYASEIGLDPVRFAADSHSDEIRARLQKDGNAGLARGVRNTPTIFVNGVQMRGNFDPPALRAAIQDALPKGKS